jgi:hypothetical protein
MAIILPTPKDNLNKADITSSQVEACLENPMKDDPIVSDKQNTPDLLAKASKDAELAKTAVRKAISQAFKEREDSLKKAETMAPAFDEALHSNHTPSNQPANKNPEPASPIKSTEYINKVLLKKALASGNSSQSTLTDIIKTYFGNKPDSEVKKESCNPTTTTSLNKNLRQVIEHVSEDQANIKAAKMLGDAKSDRVASKLAANQAQEEIKRAREEAEMVKRTADVAVSRAHEEAKASRKDAEEAVNNAKKWVEQVKNEVIAEKKTAGLIASQAQQEALSKAVEEIKRAKDEVKAAKEAANTAIRMAKEEVSKAREEADIYKKNSQAAIAALEEKVQKVVEKVKSIKQQSLISISEAQAETLKANEDAEKTRRECQATLKQAEAENQKVKEEAKLETIKARDAIIQSEKRAYEQVREKMDQVKEEAEKTRHSAFEAVAKAQEDSRQAQEDAAIIQKASEDAVSEAIEQRRKTQEEAAKAKQIMMELVNKAKEESRKAKEEAEAAIIRANDTMIKAQQDIIGRTISEISSTRQELEDAVNNPHKLGNEQTEDNSCSLTRASNLSPELLNAALHEMRTPLHSISGFARLMLDEDVNDTATQKEFLSIVVQQSENLTRLLDDLSGKLEPDNENPETEAAD